jgi:leucyl aminopeptidase
MRWQIDTSPWTEVQADWLVVGVTEGPEFPRAIADLDQRLGGKLSRLRESKDLSGKSGEVVTLLDVPGVNARRLLLVGLGPAEKSNAVSLSKALQTAARQISTREKQRVAVAVESFAVGEAVDAALRAALTAMYVGSAGQDLYRAEKARYPFDEVIVLVDPGFDAAAAQRAAEEGEILGEAVNLTRELVNEPPSVIYPTNFAERAVKLAGELGLKCDVLDEPRLRQERMGSMLAVAQGSAQPPRLVVLEHQGAPTGPTLALCGKGVTFDSGGLSLKNTEGMLTMKCDMAGAATVLGVMTAVARLKLPVRVVGYMGLVENMPSGTSFKLGDVLHARNGVTIEVQNTDAEGRLVLADVLSYAVDRGADYLIDLATLTGACVVALGEEVSGAFTNEQEWCDRVVRAARACGDEVWQLPMYDSYAELIKSDIADIRNVGGRWGGAITAAKFLERFVGGKPWVHLDIAGPAFASSSKPYREGGGTGHMVRGLIELARSFA